MEWIDEADGVFRGGGVKGIGLAGALEGFRDHPTRPIARWVNVAGASAGAIIASYLAVKGDDAVQGLVALLQDTEQFARFQDFPPGGKWIGGVPNLLFKHGLAHGDAFRTWFDGVLGGATFAQVKNEDGTGSRLKLIAVDVTNRALLVLPDDLALYRRPNETKPIEADNFRIADAARMSMSIPYFFEPVELVRDYVRVTDSGDTALVAGEPADRREVEEANDAADAKAGYEEVADPPSAWIIDGGTLSNFPVWLFDVNPAEAGREPKRFTFGFTLRGGLGVAPTMGQIVRHLPWLFRFGFDIFHTAQDAWDARFVSHSTRVRTVTVDAGDVATTEFELTSERKEMLLRNGRVAGALFLDRLDPTAVTNTYHARPAIG
jgi:NTE family protein